ncbi:ABC transporter permease [Bacillus sp. HNG]|uniref:ABC transporter permease n=1 Tax=Bacillus sp. HNG TaxID=2293325 RepID=UPI000E2FAC7D|nr:ABC transporter permease [Bacillus sp. HNG]RFB15191.1 ABC transporter permease [Bacillus sp. HNG]
MFLALRELKHAKLRFFMIGMILVLISWLVFILSGLGNGLSLLSASAFKNMDANYVVFEEGARHSMLRSVISEDLSEELKNQEHVNDVAPMGSRTAVVLKENATSDDEKIDVSLLGINPGTFLEPEVIEGNPLTKGKDKEVIVNNVLQNKGIKLGDTLEIEGSTEVIKVVGFVKDQSFNHLPAIFMTMDLWRTIHFAAPGSDMGIKNPVNAIMLQGENIIQEDIDQSVDGIETTTKQEAINGLPGYTAENGTIMMMLTFLLAISAVVITVFFYVITLQKSNQFGIMKAIGASNSFLGRAVISQVFILAVISIGLGVLLTYGTAAILPEAMPFALDPMLVFTYAFVLLVVSVLSTLLSVRKITKIDPLQAIGRVE